MRRTLSDWIAAARAADVDPEARAGCLDAAAEVAVADGCWALRQVLAALVELAPADRSRIESIAGQTLAAAIAELAVWGFVDVAVARAQVLGDRVGAAAALAAGEVAFAADGAPVYRWCILGRGYLTALEDDAGARRCLVRGLAVARAGADVGGLADVARAHVARGEPDSATALLREAEALPGASAEVWSLVNVWGELGAIDAIDRLLERALVDAAVVDDALRTARAAASHRRGDAVEAALERARSLAEGAGAWLEVAETAHDVGADPALVRDALDHASAVDADEATRHQIAAGYLHWLGDADAAARCGPHGVRPEALRVRSRTFPGPAPDTAGLIEWLRAGLSDASLEAIAEVDYGYEAAKKLATLRDLRAQGLLPRRLDAGIHEAFALTRWSSGAGVDHRARAFACALLLVDTHDDDPADTTPILVESCLALGDEATRLGAGYLAWIASSDAPPLVDEDEEEDEEDEEDEGADPSALLGLALLVAAVDPGDPALDAITQALIDHPWCGAEGLQESLRRSLRAELWDDLIAAYLVPAVAERPAIARLLAHLGRA
ncbi:MAG: hypothetical protein H6711_02655 [Myxococcales bacterium]|nr:hypothetical protein [Myxococcales bacterium]